MRILYHHRTLADGAEGIHIAAMVAAFRSLGHEVHVAALAGAGGRTAAPGIAEHLKRVLPAPALEVAALASNLPDYAATKHAIRTFRPDFMYKRHARHDVGAIYAARHEGVPIVLEVNCLFTGRGYRNFEPPRLERTAARLERRALELSSIVLGVSTPLVREIEQIGAATPILMPNGADPQRFNRARANARAVRARLGLGSGLVLGWAGIIREWHLVELLLDAVTGVPEVRVLVVGDGPGRRSLEERAAALGLGDRLVITGRVPHQAMPDHIAAMDIAVVASDGTGVASPMKLLEYMAMERPVVAPRLENIEDVIDDGTDGLLFTPGDGSDLRRVVHRLAGDPGLRLALGCAGRRKVERTRNWGENARRVLALVGERVVAEPGTTSHAWRRPTSVARSYSKSRSPMAPVHAGEGNLGAETRKHG